MNIEAKFGDMQQQLALVVSDLQKHYGSTVALDGLSVGVTTGSVHAILGENGAGKSTLVKVLSGLTRPDAGQISVFGEQVSINGPRDAHALGIRTAFQEISLVKDLTVAQNFLLMEEPLNRVGLVSKRASEEFVQAELQRLGLNDLDPRAKVVNLDLPTRQKIEIARSVSREPLLLLLDEPTASLSSQDVQWLASIIEKLESSGTTIVFISHRMQEVREFCTKLSILRNGKSVGSYRVDEISEEDVIEMMIGRSLDIVFPAKRPPPNSDAVLPSLAVRELSASGILKNVTFDLWPGQILGVGGLQGMGQRELFLALFGAATLEGGEIVINGSPVALRSPADAVQADIGISLVPEDRKTEGLFLELSGKENLTLPSLDRFVELGIVDLRKEERAVLEAFARVQVAPLALHQPVKQFSGGNQQKMVIAKWLMTGSRILLLYDPTRGVDVGTKAEIYRLIHDFAADGGSILIYSSEISELVNLCNQVLVVYRGQISEVPTGGVDGETLIMRAALGQMQTADSPKEEHGSRVD